MINSYFKIKEKIELKIIIHKVKTMKLTFLIVGSAILTLSCGKTSTEQEIINYKNNSDQLIGQWLLEFSKNASIKCVMENEPIDSLPGEIKNTIIHKLEIKAEKHLYKQLKLTHHFTLTDSLIGDLNLITLKKQRELKEQRDNGEPFWIWYNANCEGKWLNISRPIFNEDYTLAYFEVSTSCVNYLCGHGGKSIYKYENGKWIAIENFDNFIS
ncbi:hypothetical protein DHB64_18785 [Antarcticibacterium sp. W02-3]|nr:hypothetical protein [Antarcticibacterium sp. W02-3]